MIPLKTENDLIALRRSGAILAEALEKLKSQVVPGIMTLELDQQAEAFITKKGAIPAFKGYKGYPASICASVNEEIVHGIPGRRRLKNGDIISIDVGVNLNGYFTDAAVTLAVGKITEQLERLIEVTKGALCEGIAKLVKDEHLSDISACIQSFVEKNGFSVVRQFVGHGVGFDLHEEPEIPNFGKPGEGPMLKPGMVLAIEPMVNLGSGECEILENGWTAVTLDRLASAHFEHTVAITERGPEILTA